MIEISARINAGVDPDTARGGAVVLELLKVLDLFSFRPGVAIDLFEHRVSRWHFLCALRRIIPGEIFYRLVFGILAIGVKLLQALAEVKHEPKIRAAITRRLDDFVVPLEQSLGIGKAAFFLTGQCRRK